MRAKMKTCKAVSKRFKISGTGKLLYQKAGRRHLLNRKPAKRMRPLRRADLRVELDDRSEKMQYKIREAQLQKIPYMLVVGNREQTAHSVAVRTRAGGDEGTLAVEALVARLQAESQRPS